MNTEEIILLVTLVVMALSFAGAFLRASVVRYQKKLNFSYKETNIAGENLFIFMEKYRETIEEFNATKFPDGFNNAEWLKGEIQTLKNEYLFLESGLFSSQLIKWDETGKVKKVRIYGKLKIKIDDNSVKIRRKLVYKVLLNKLKDLNKSYNEVHSVNYEGQYIICTCIENCKGKLCYKRDVSKFFIEAGNETKRILSELSHVVRGYSESQYKDTDFVK